MRYTIRRVVEIAGFAAVSALLAFSTAACQDSNDSSAGKPSLSGDGDLKQDGFAFANYLGVEMDVIEFARQKGFEKCLAGFGYPQNMQAGKGRPYPTTSVFMTNPGQFGLVSEELARVKGFGSDPGWTPPVVASFDNNYDSAVDKCQASSWKPLGSDAEKVYFDYQDLGNELLPYRVEVDGRLPKDLPRKMMECIEAAGYQVPDEAQFLKTPQPQLLGITFGGIAAGEGAKWQPDPAKHTVQVGPPTPERHYVPTPEESKLAVAWYHCQQQTGSTSAQLAAAAQVQREYVEKRADRLLELNPKIAAIAKKAAELASRDR
ncbi:hypothetical protein [Actinoplanes siamensis]|uniref:Uncharacterized protein n=1 Tax=Actinoplanes siamensis TaxID=1223317 RepID=A0A919N303_9ACTN|nr:hypothetical protein [Actinoplanes siamensis]GIF02833.1 hypothetical protein Asi03nite_03710 [Actinoplanes siamensis]